MAALLNAQDFIRALKASADPPQVGGPFKIEIARQAWDSPSLYVPNKAEAIAEWLLSTLLKDKSRRPAENPICDDRYWKLLGDLLSNSNGAKVDNHPRSPRPWLVPLLSRIPIAPVILSYFDILRAGGASVGAFHAVAARCISALWPLAVPKFSPETLLECFGAVVQLGISSGIPDAPCDPLQALDESRALSAIVSSYRASLANSAGKRKQLYALFLKKHLSCWLQLVSWAREGQAATIVSDIYDAGIETMFGLDTIKQAADHKHDTVLTESLEAALGESSDAVFRALPQLFASYIQSVKRHKGALFSQGSNQAPGHITEQVQRATMAFYAGFVSLAHMSVDVPAWQCRVSLLELVEKENLLSPKDEDAKALLRRDGELAIEVLSDAWDETSVPRIDRAVQILATLTRIDYDLMSPSFPLVYPKMMAVHGRVQSASQFLNLLLEYDAKTRSLPSAIAYVSEAFSVHHLERIPGGPQAAYRVASAGPLTSLPFLDELSRVVHSFLTPGQVLDLIGEVARRLADAYDGFRECEARRTADRGDGPRKKRKKERDAPAPAPSAGDGRAGAEHLAVSFALVARTMVVVLRALPLQSLADEGRAEAERRVREVHAAVAARVLADAFGGAGRREEWAWQVVGAGALRLHYGLSCARGLPPQPPLDRDLLTAILGCIGEEDTSPELVVEILRTLLHQCSTSAFEADATLDGILDYLAAHLSKKTVPWSGKAHDLASHAEGAIAILHLLLDRWLPEFDAWANPKQLERLASILVNVDMEPSPSSSGLHIQGVLTKMLHDAQFWELHKLRDAFLAQLSEQTACLADMDLPGLLSSLSADSPHPSTAAVVRVAAAFSVLHLTPLEFVPRGIHLEFLKRGFAADVSISLTLRCSKKPRVSERHLVIVRDVLRRTITHLDTVESLADSPFWSYLSEPGLTNENPSQELISATVDLVDIYQKSLIRIVQRKPSVGQVLEHLVVRCGRAFEHNTSSVAQRAALLLIDAVLQTPPGTSLHPDCDAGFHALHTRMLEFATPLLLKTSQESIPLDEFLLDVWSHLRTFGRWLGKEEQVPFIGKELTRRLLCTEKPQTVVPLAPIALSILLGESQTPGHPNHTEQVEYTIVTYLSLARVCGSTGMQEGRISSACRTLPTTTFSLMLDLAYDGLRAEGGLVPDDVASLVHLSSVLLRDTPEGTSKICQAHTTKCLNLFADDERYITLPSLRREALDFLVRQCNDRPASLRTADIPAIWSFLQALLAGSSTHDSSTDLTIFHGVVNALGALVRLRRDLVLHTLPHLGNALRRLIACLRAPRPQLGAKQRRLVMDTLPRWLAPPLSSPDAPTQALGATESKALARLLTTLLTKTLVRGHDGAQGEKGQGQSRKPEALARPFAKHAAYVLAAHAEAANDALCVLGAGVRRELQPGLFALCDMLGEHSRDAMMVSALDAGGKATMKALWREYEKQRYVGKG